MPCFEFRCLAGCTYDADCKLGYACKGFAFGAYCGQTGSKAVGEPCFDSSGCAGSSSCYFPEHGGYCTNIGCQSNADCVAPAQCVTYGTTTLCAQPCQSNGDCRAGEGYSCQPKTLPNDIPVTVCLPIP